MEERPLWEPSDTDEQVDPTEGVRLIGADEAAEALERGEVASRRDGDSLRYGDRPPSPDDGSRPTLRFPLGRDESGVDLVRPRVSAPAPVSVPDTSEGPSRRWSAGEAERQADEQPDDDAELVEPVFVDDRIEPLEPVVDSVAPVAPVDGPGEGAGPADPPLRTPRWIEQPLDLDDADLEDATTLDDEEITVDTADEPEEPVAGARAMPTGADTPPDPDPAPASTERGSDVDADDADSEDDDAGGGSDAAPTQPVPRVTSSGEAEGIGAVSAKPPPVEPLPEVGTVDVGEHGGGAKEVPPRDVRLAIVSGLALAVAALGLFWLGEAAATVLVTVIAVVCSAELFSALRRSGYQPATLLGLVATAGLVAAAYWRGEAAIPIVLGLTVVVALLWYLIGVTRLEPTMNAGVSILAVAYVGLLASFAPLLLRNPNGRGMVGGIIIAVVANDVCALVVGRRFGKRLVAPLVSPAKTVEGLVGGGVASVAVSVLLVGSHLGPLGMHPWDVGSALALGVVVAVMAPLGDLCESMIKRDLGIKDMSAIIPGHGGVLDRVDALLFCLPAVYYLSLVLDLT